MINVYEQVDRNKSRSAIIMVLFVLVIALAAYFMGRALGFGLSGVGIALVLAGLMSLGSYYFSDKIILSISGARPADKKRDFHFFTVVENLAMASQIPKPKLYVIEDSAPNAFATGRDPEHAVVCATTGLLKKLNRTELEGVVAHELSHIKNYDIRLMSIVVVLVGMVTLLADWFLRSMYLGRRGKDRGGNQIQAVFLLIGLLLALLSPLVARLMQLALSRQREFLADASASMLTRYPEGFRKNRG
jgi:heat shock protein HtpX